MTKGDVAAIAELGPVFVILSGLLGFIHEGGFGTEAVVGALAGALLFALTLTVGALLGIGRSQNITSSGASAAFRIYEISDAAVSHTGRGISIGRGSLRRPSTGGTGRSRPARRTVAACLC